MSKKTELSCSATLGCMGILIVMGIISVALTAAVLVGPRTYTATAWIQFLHNKPYYIYKEQQLQDYDAFVNTHIALMRSPLVIDKALENPVVANLLEVKRQRDKRHWLAANLKILPQHRSEMVTVSFSSRNPKTAEEIVNSVLNAFFDFYESQSNDWNARMINQLNLELNRQQNAARLLQEEIRDATQRVAGNGGAAPVERLETLQRDLYLAEASLEAARAELTAQKEMLSGTIKVPEAALQVAIESDADYIALVKRQKEVEENLDARKRFWDESDPAVQEAKVLVQEALDRVTAHLQSVSVEIVEKLQREMRAKIAETVWEKEVAVRTREIFTGSLRSRHQDAVREAAGSAVDAADVSFQQEQLKRINSVLDLLQQRVVMLQTEMNAPPQIQLRKKAGLPQKKDWWW